MKNLLLEKKKIVMNTAMAFGIGAILLVTAVLPAEYGIDPVGAGKLFGFSRLYIAEETETVVTEVKPEKQNFRLLKMEDAGAPETVQRPKEINNPAPKKHSASREDEMDIVIPAGKGLEYKLKMKKYDQLKYEWTSNGVTLFHDFHGEVKVGDSYSNFWETYTLAYAKNMVGTFLAPFEGKHGWYFKNTSDKDVTVKLRLKGQYSL